MTQAAGGSVSPPPGELGRTGSAEGMQGSGLGLSSRLAAHVPCLSLGLGVLAAEPAPSRCVLVSPQKQCGGKN